MDTVPREIICVIYHFCDPESRPEFRATCKFIRNSLTQIWQQWIPASRLFEYRTRNPEVRIHGIIYDMICSIPLNYTEYRISINKSAKIYKLIKDHLCSIEASSFMTVTSIFTSQYENVPVSKSYLISNGKCEMTGDTSTLRITDARIFTIKLTFCTYVVHCPGSNTRDMIRLFDAILKPAITF